LETVKEYKKNEKVMREKNDSIFFQGFNGPLINILFSVCCLVLVRINPCILHVAHESTDMFYSLLFYLLIVHACLVRNFLSAFHVCIDIF
jgi:hypothetical protein